MKMSNCITPSTMTADAKSSLVDGEVLGQDADGSLIQWDFTTGAPYNSGQSVKEFGVSNLSEGELERLKFAGSVEERDTNRMAPAWSDEHRDAAKHEGWDIWDTSGSECGPWQIQRFDEAHEIPGVKLDCDDDALRIVVSGSAPHHEAARQFIKAHNAQEWEALKRTIQKMGKVSNFIEQPHQSALDKGMLLRTKALALLQEAQAVDGLKPFTVTHTHSFGESTYVLWAAEKPIQEEAEAVLDSEFEPDREETLVVEDCFSLEEMSGVAVTSRLPDLLGASNHLAKTTTRRFESGITHKP